MVHIRKGIATLAAVVILLSALVPGRAKADFDPEFVAAFTHLAALGVVQGKADGKPHLEDTLTRAEAVTILVNAFGEGVRSKDLVGAAAFPDTIYGADGKFAWYSGAVAVAKEKGWVKGDLDGKFNPEAQVTFAQFLTMLVRALGLGTDPTLGWPVDHLYAAGRAGIVPANDDLLVPNMHQPIPRGAAAFYADRAFSRIKMITGRTILQTYIKPYPSDLKVLAPLETTAPSLTIKGTAPGATWLTLDDKTVPLGKDGSFAVNVNVALGANTFAFAAGDLVDNVATKQLTITRSNSSANNVVVRLGDQSTVSLSLYVGVQTEPISFQVLDTNQAAIADAPVTAQVTPATLGTFTPATGRFTAGTKPGSGALVLTSGTVTKTIPITLKTSALARISVAAPKLVLASGMTTTFTAQGFDVYDNPVPLGTVTWSATGGLMLPSGEFAATTPGRVQVTASFGTVSASTWVDVAGQATALQVAATSPLIANGKSQTTLTITALDANQVQDLAYEGPVTLVMNDATNFVLSAKSIYLQGGAGSVTLSTTVVSAGQSVGIVVQQGLPGGQVFGANLKAGALVLPVMNQELTRFTAAADTTTVRLLAGSKMTVTISALDQVGQPMLAGHMPVVYTRLTSSNNNFDLYTETGVLLSNPSVLSATGLPQLKYKVGNAKVLGKTTITAEVITGGYTQISIPTVDCTAIWN